MRSLALNLERRLMTFKFKDGSTEKLMKAIHQHGPLMYGKEEVGFLSNVFRIDDIEARRGLQEYIDVVRQEGINQKPSATLTPLRNAVKTSVVSSADCERGFSQMNILATPIRSSLSMKTLSSLTFIKCVGAPPRLFDPSPYTRTWVTRNHFI